MLCRTPTPVLVPGVLHAQAVDQHCARQGSRCWRHLPFSTGDRKERLRGESLLFSTQSKKACLVKVWPTKSYLSFHAVAVQKLHGWKLLTNHELPKKLHTWELIKKGFAQTYWPIRSCLISRYLDLLTFRSCLISRHRLWLTENFWPIRQLAKLIVFNTSSMKVVDQSETVWYPVLEASLLYLADQSGAV